MAAFEAVMVAAIGVGILLAPMTVIWLVENDLRYQVNEAAAWAIYQYGKKQNEKLQSA